MWQLPRSERGHEDECCAIRVARASNRRERGGRLSDGSAPETHCMAYDEKLAQRLRALLAKERDVTEKKMFGGLGFLVRGNMCVSASGKGGMLVRIDPEDSDEALARPHATLMEMGG